MNYAVTLLALVLAFAPFSARAQQLPASQRDRSDVAKYATALETDPLSKSAKKNRVKVLTIINRSPDLRIRQCRALLGELLMSKKLGARELLVQLQISGAKYLAEHPGTSPDDEAVLVSGLEGVVATYRAMRSSNPLVQIDLMDELVDRASRGELGSVVGDALADCEGTPADE